MSISALEALEKRRTVRQYDPDYQIPEDQLQKIMHATQCSPTACDFQGQDYIVVTNKEKLAQLEKVVMDALPEGEMKAHFKGRTERHGVKNVVTCDATTLVLFVKNERAADLWVNVDVGIASMGLMVAAQNFGIESMCLGIVATPDTQAKCEELFGLKKGSLVLGVALGKMRGTQTFPNKEFKCKVTYQK